MSIALLLTLATTRQDITDPKRPLTPQLFPKLSGRNGFEEFFQAVDDLGPVDGQVRKADASRTSAALLKMRLARTALHRKSIELVLEGVAKPCAEPRRVFLYSTLFPELTSYKELGRLLVDRAEVEFAQGRRSEGVQTLSSGLTFGAVIGRGPTLIEMLTGSSIESMMFRALGDHFMEVPPNKLALLQRQAHMGISGVPKRLQVTLDFEFRHETRLMSALIQREIPPDLQDSENNVSSPEDALEVVEQLTESGTPAAQLHRLNADIANASAARQDSWLQALRLGGKRCLEDARRMLSRPESAWGPVEPHFGDPDLALLWQSVASVTGQAVLSQAKLRLQYRLLAVQSAIGEFKAVRGALPRSLRDLGSFESVLDPFTGKPFRYQIVHGLYRLSSPGPKGSGPITLGHAFANARKGDKAPLMIP
jgi:hypothetical protein